jgi:hypothetical protein
MKLWVALYGMIWAVVLETLIGMKPDPPTWVLYVHLALGLLLIGFAYWNRAQLVGSRAPARIKRIAGATYGLTYLMAGLGVLLWFHVGDSWATPVPGYSVYTGLLIFHALNAFAILTQAAAVAIAYDMWEDREFEEGSLPGEVPAPGRDRTALGGAPRLSDRAARAEAVRR